MQNADSASLGCEQNLQYIENTNTTVANILDVLETISSKTQKLSEISQGTSAATEENEKIINQAISYMEEIVQSSVMPEILSSFNVIDNTADDLRNLSMSVNL